MEAENPTSKQLQSGLYPRELIDKCRENYVQGRGSLADIAAKCGIKVCVLRYHSRVKKWGKARAEYEAAKARSAIDVPYASPEVEVVKPDNFQAEISEFLASYREVKQLWKEAVEESRNLGLTASERTSWARVAKDLHVRWQETLRIPAIAALKPVSNERPQLEKPAVPLEE